jgi:hypothetical protein
MTFSRLEAISGDAYRAWFEDHRAALRSRTPFHQPAWLRVVERGLGADVVSIGTFEGDEIVAAVPGCLSRRGPFRLFGSHLRGTMTSYLGPLGLDGALADGGMPRLLSACCRFARRRWGRDYVEFTLPEAPLEDGRVPGPAWEREAPGSYQLDLTVGEDALWSGLRSSCRRAVRKARKQELQIVPLDDADLYVDLLDATFARHDSVSPHPRRFFHVMLEELVPRDLLWAWGVEYEGEVIAGGLFLHDDREAHYLSGASLLTGEYRSLRANNLLHWHAIATAAQHGLRVYDFGGRGIPGIDRFKESFGPEPVDYWSANWAPGHVRWAKDVFLSLLPHWRRLQRWLRGDGA